MGYFYQIFFNIQHFWGKGTGLGLAIARQIVEETHAEKLNFNSILGDGTEFIIEIPV
nr:ATP-binding protein [Nostoc sp. 'Peltigera membranacea cyanobiont' 213]